MKEVVDKNLEALVILKRFIDKGWTVLLSDFNYKRRGAIVNKVAEYVSESRDVTLLGYSDNYEDIKKKDAVTFQHSYDRIGREKLLDSLWGRGMSDKPSFFMYDGMKTSVGSSKALEYLAGGNQGFITHNIENRQTIKMLAVYYLICAGKDSEDEENVAKAVREVVCKALDVIVFVSVDGTLDIFEVDKEFTSGDGLKCLTDGGKPIKVYEESLGALSGK